MERKGTKTQLLGIELNFISLVFSAIAKVLNKFALGGLSPVFGALMTSVFAAGFTLILIGIQDRELEAIRNPAVLWLGLTNGLGVILQYVALSFISPVTVTLIAQVYLIYVFILAYFGLHEKLRGLDYLAIVCCLTGAFLVGNYQLQLDFSSLVGVLAAFVYPLMFAANNLLAKYLVDQKSQRPNGVLLYNHGVSAAFMLIAAFLVPKSFAGITTQALAFNFGGAFFNGFLALLLFFISLKYITAGRANIVRASGPLFVIVLSYVFFPVPITPQLLIGALLLIAATSIVTATQAAK
ncbi:MAG: DMT family transporter [Lactobacillus sp.]|jgi:drug/metabolite transporter (DMT)-like permease|nr:DMT family transporter [Lactobacillus sp.]